MKRTLLLGCIILLLSPFTRAQSLEIGWELWYPYQYRDKSQQLIGLDFDIVRAVLQQAKLQANFTELPWQRHLNFIESGKMDVAMGASFTKERESYAFFTLPYRTETVKLFIRKQRSNEIKLNKLSDLIDSDYLIGIEQGYYYGQTYQQLSARPEFMEHINEVLDIEQNIQLLMDNKIDGVLVDPVTLKSFSEKYRLEGELVALPLTIYQTDIHIMLSKASCDSKLLARFDSAITELKKNGTIARIFRRWSHQNTEIQP